MAHVEQTWNNSNYYLYFLRGLISQLITSILKSLAFPVIWLVKNGAIYSQIASFSALNRTNLNIQWNYRNNMKQPIRTQKIKQANKWTGNILDFTTTNLSYFTKQRMTFSTYSFLLLTIPSFKLKRHLMWMIIHHLTSIWIQKMQNKLPKQVQNKQTSSGNS